MVYVCLLSAFAIHCGMTGNKSYSDLSEPGSIRFINFLFTHFAIFVVCAHIHNSITPSEHFVTYTTLGPVKFLYQCVSKLTNEKTLCL